VAKDRNVELEIRAKNLTEAAFKKVADAIKHLEDASEATSAKGTQSWGKWFATIAGGVAVGNLISSTFKSVLGTVAQIPGQLMEIAKRGNDVADVKEAFVGLAGGGEQANAILKELRTQFGHTVNDFELMKSSNELLRKGVGMTAQEFGVLTQGARILANQVGGDGKANFDRFLSAIGRGNERELRDLGVNMANIERAVDRQAAAWGKESSALSQAQKQQAMKNAVLEEANRLLRENGPVQNGFNDNLKAAETLVQNWTDRLGEAIATSPQLNTALNHIVGGMAAAFGHDPQEQVKSIARLIGHVAIAGVNAAQYLVSGAELVARAYYQVREIFSATMAALNAKKIRETEILLDAFRAMNQGSQEVRNQIRALEDELAQLQGRTKGFSDDAAFAAQMNKDLATKSEDLRRKLAEMELAMRAAGEATGEASRTGRGLIGTQGALGESSAELAKLQTEVTKKLREMAAAADAAAKNNVLEAWARQNASALQKLAIDAMTVGKTLQGPLKDALVFNMKADGAQFAAKEFDRIIKEQQATHFKAVDAMNTKFTTSLDLRAGAFAEYHDLVAKRTMTELQYQLEVIQREEDAKILQLQRLGYATAENLELIRAVTAEKMAAARLAHNTELERMRREVDSWGKRFRDIVGAVPSLLKSAFTGGGGAKGFGQALSVQIGESLFGKGAEKLMTKGFQGLFNKGLISARTLGGLAEMIPGLGGAIGALAGPLLGKVFSFFGNKERKENEAATKEVRALGGELLTTYGSMENLRLLGQMTGKDIAGSFGHAGKKGLEQFKLDAKEFEKAVGELRTRVNRDLGGVLEEFRGMGFSIPAALQPSLDKLREMNLLTEDTQALLRGFGDQATIDYKRMEEAAARYGIHVDKLGQGFNNAKISASVQQILEDYDLLTRGGAEPTGILEDMADEISEVAQRAMRLGISMPENMRPILQALVDKGLLLDANGEKIEDLNGMSFGDPIKVGLERIADLLEKLLKGLGIDLPNALNNIPRRVDIDINAHVRTHGELPASGYAPDDSGLGMPTFRGAAAGGLFTRPTFRVLAEREPEIVGSPNVISDAIATALRQAGGGLVGGGEVVIENVTLVTRDHRVLADVVVPEIPHVVKRRVGPGRRR